MALLNDEKLKNSIKKQKRTEFFEDLAEFSKRFKERNIPSAVQFIRENRDNDSFRR